MCIYLLCVFAFGTRCTAGAQKNFNTLAGSRLAGLEKGVGSLDIGIHHWEGTGKDWKILGVE